MKEGQSTSADINGGKFGQKGTYSRFSLEYSCPMNSRVSKIGETFHQDGGRSMACRCKRGGAEVKLLVVVTPPQAVFPSVFICSIFSAKVNTNY